jgi:hypothetical protein
VLLLLLLLLLRAVHAAAAEQPVTNSQFTHFLFCLLYMLLVQQEPSHGRGAFTIK